MADGQNLAIHQRVWISQKESAVAPEEQNKATLEDLEKIFEEYGHKPQIAKGLVGMVEDVRWTDRGTRVTAGEQIHFLLRFLDQEYVSPLAEEIYAEVVKRLLEGVLIVLHTMTGEPPYPLQRLVDFLGQRPPLEGARGKVREFLAGVAHSYLVPGRQTTGAFVIDEPAVEALSRRSLARALLRYRVYRELEDLAENEWVRYKVIPLLFEMVVEQVGEENAGWVEGLVRWRWDEDSLRRDARYVAKAFLLAGSDTRWVRLLFDLAQAYLDEHREPYLEELRLT